MGESSKPRTKSRQPATPVGLRAALSHPLSFVIPAKAGIQSGMRRLLKLLVDPVGPGRADTPPSGPRAGVPVRGAWESACGWEARWNSWLANPSGPMWRGDGEQPHRR